MGVLTTKQIATKSHYPRVTYVQDKGFGRNTGTEVTTTTGHECGPNLAAGHSKLSGQGRRIFHMNLTEFEPIFF